MPFLAPEMQQVLAGILAAILWTYFQGGRMCFKKMKSDEIELLRSDCISHFVQISSPYNEQYIRVVNKYPMTKNKQIYHVAD